ncbi:putative proton-dependent oligopeptide transporter family, major facilitator superfamily [Rosa chinensis]|uniref:Putative proton-dependent oligopeptide transporter family, major facilitator superfamily n=1 Tax=Rosa chinensis TaxID=74649 RepID=A0A2P6QRA5_ROSCH|nr:protein NRT1/ PTR FAMILY 5.2 [Rosa chinensis]PRQ36719.1 putative proton-dependent oligopeptide transporter family, major facilitator superfamily [Rosa chinensis]
MAAVEQGVNPNQYTQDGTVDLKGNPVLRSKRGGWTACAFVVVYEVFERMAYYGISSNLILYLTNKLHQGTVTSANNVTNWVGTIWITPILGAYVADAHLGRYWTFLIACIIYLSGMSVLTLAVSLPALKPPKCLDANIENCKKASTLQLAVFYGSLYTLAIGTGGTKPNISTIGADQFDDFDPKEKAQKLSFFNWWMFSIFFGTLFANTILVYIQDNVGWTLGYALPTLGLLISILIFLAGTPFYRHKVPSGSPFTRMARVIVAALRKWKVTLPSDPKEFHELHLDDYATKGKFRIDSTPSIRFLNKAAVKTASTSPWRLCSVTQVEETKQMLRMIPILLATFVPSIMVAQIHTLFVKQGTTLNRRVGNFKIPPASLAGFVTLSMLINVVLYDRFFVKFMRKLTKNPRGITLLQRMGIGMILHIFIMVIASLTERYRLNIAKEHGVVESGGQVPLTILVLLPQFVLMGTADAFLEVAKIEFFYDQAPESMKSLGTSYSMTTLGIGNFLSSFLLSTVSHITKEHGHKGWILNNLNASHLDYYYAFFAILNFLNFIFFLFMTKMYVYKAEISDSIKVLTEELKEATMYRLPNQEDQSKS